MARWVAEETIEELEVQVTVQVLLREVTAAAKHLRSPGGSKPMQRKYTYIATPEVAAFDKELAKKVHLDNLNERGRIEAEFEKAAGEQPRIEARRRDAIRRAKNVKLHGCARGVSGSAKKKPVVIVESPVTVDAKAMDANVHAVMCPSSSDASDVSVEKAHRSGKAAPAEHAMCET